MAPATEASPAKRAKSEYVHTKDVSGACPRSAVTLGALCDQDAAANHDHHRPSVVFLQSFMDAYKVIKNDLMEDELLDKPPAFSQEWTAEVRANLTYSRHMDEAGKQF